MDEIQSELVRLFDGQAIAFDVLASPDAQKWADEIRRHFCDSCHASLPIWEALLNEKSFYDVENIEAKRLLSSIDRPVIMLIDDWHGWSGFVLRDGNSVALALEGIYNFVWYVVDATLTSLVCRNDHDFVMFSQHLQH